MFRRLILLSLVLILLAGISGLLAWKWFNSRLDSALYFNGESTLLVVKKGDTLLGLARHLKASGLIKSRLPLSFYARCCANGIIAMGEYRIPAGESIRGMVQRLLDGRVIQHKITFPEGKRFSEWLTIIAADPVLSSSEAVSDTVLETLLEGGPVEGWLFPDTYAFTRGDLPISVLRQARDKMRRILAAEWGLRVQGLPIQTPYEALILASIVEKETGVARERCEISGVFIRRLKKGMRLQTDPTVIYGLGEQFDGNLTRKHLAEKTAYNTYKIYGLPPTPIANPGLAAIKATLHPCGKNALYFVARGDGSHYFSLTLSEHRRAVRQFQLNRKKGYRSTPALD